MLSGFRSLARRYARALADASPKDLSAAAGALDGWRETVRRSPDLSSLLADPRLPKPARSEIAVELFQKLGAPRTLLHLVALLIEENRFGLIDLIYDAFVSERESREGILCAVVETPRPLTDQVRERIRSRLAEILRLHVRIEERLRPAAIGGVNLQIGSRVWYGTARHRLAQVFR